jgi:hypothetical protein
VRVILLLRTGEDETWQHKAYAEEQPSMKARYVCNWLCFSLQAGMTSHVERSVRPLALLPRGEFLGNITRAGFDPFFTLRRDGS